MAIDYLHSHLEPAGQRTAVDEVVQALRAIGLDKFEAIAWRGVSGALVAPVASYILGIPNLPVRKGEDSHSEYPCESPFIGEQSGKYDPRTGNPIKYVVVDDLVSSGRTLKAIAKGIDAVHPGSTMVACITYRHRETDAVEVINKCKVPVLGVQTLQTFPDRLGYWQRISSATGNYSPVEVPGPEQPLSSSVKELATALANTQELPEWAKVGDPVYAMVDTAQVEARMFQNVRRTGATSVYGTVEKQRRDVSRWWREIQTGRFTSPPNRTPQSQPWTEADIPF